MPAKLSTQVLDLSVGRPAAGMTVELWRLGSRPRLIKTVVTNSDGRTDVPLLGAEEMVEGQFEIVFHVGRYFAGQGVSDRFLDRVPVRFNLADPGASCHVPLLCTPWSYSTYRGS